MSNHVARRVLVIDDDADIGEEICQSLALKDIDGVYAENISQARSKLAEAESPSVVIVDYNMPGMNGIEVVNALKKEYDRHLAFIMLTGDDTQASPIGAVKEQIFDFLRKPVDGLAVAEAVRRAADHLAQRIEADNQNEAVKVEMESLKLRVEAISQILQHREILVQKLLLADRSAFDAESRPQLRETTDSGADSAPLECVPVDVSALLYRMLPAVKQLAGNRNIVLKSRISNHLPFLYGDQKRLTRALGDFMTVLFHDLSKGDSVTILAVKDSGELLISFKVAAGAPLPAEIRQGFHARPDESDRWPRRHRDVGDETPR